MFFSIKVLPLFALAIHGATVTYDFDIEWMTANPDGVFERAVMGINGQWPIPPIVASVGDRLVVNVNNKLMNASTSLHFHGLYQNGTTHMDGPVGVTQCLISPGASFKYDFNITQPGTYWYHSHAPGQYPDGLRGSLIIHDNASPFKDQYDEEVVLTLSDWYHDQMPNLIKGFMSYSNPTGAEPVPQAALMNDTQNLTVAIQPGKTYMFRIVNMAAFAAQYLWFEDHTMRVVEVDGIYTEPADAEMLYITAAQRYSVLITAKNETSSNFAIVGSMDQDLFDAIPDGLNSNVTGWLVYDSSAPNPDPTPVDSFDYFDDFDLVPVDKMPLLENPSRSIELEVAMNNLGDGANYAFFNDITYVRPRVPTLFTALSTGVTASNASVYGDATHPFVLERGDVVEIILNNADPGKHPFHLHGHAFQTVVRSEPEAGVYVYNETLSAVPMRRDTVMVHPNGNMVLRFRADNPGIWLFHCHIEWHVVSGLVATFVEAPLDLQRTLGPNIPADHQQACQDTGVSMEGNAAGNTKDLFDLTGQTHPPAPLPAGFEAKGIVALVFSCVAAFLGLAVISWYGSHGISSQTPKTAGAVGT